MSNQTNSGPGKDIIYVDVEDEITAVIDKVRSSGQKIVALVLPKRATVMQSIVNMKLLKRTADGAKKHLVLITSEASILPLAGVVGIHVAKTPQSRPEIPPAPAGMPHPDEAEEDEPTITTHDDLPLDKTKPVGTLAGAAALHAASDEDESIELDDATDANAKPGLSGVVGKLKKDKKLRIPDFNRFRLLLVLGGVAVVLLICGLYVALAVMPKATVLVKTNSSSIDTNMDVTLSTTATNADIEQAILPAKQEKVEKSASQTVPATGSVNKGERATGTVTIVNCNFNNISIAAGTGFSADGLTFISQKSVTVPKSNYEFLGGGGFKCKNDGKASVDVLAQKPGANYNIAARDFTIASSYDNVKASGTAMDGGTDNVVKVVLQADIDNAKDKITEQDSDAIQFELEDTLLGQKLYAIKASFAATPAVDAETSVPVGSESSEVIVTQKTTFSMLGVEEKDLKKLIAAQVKDKIDDKRQTVLNYGLGDATFESLVQEEASTRVAMRVTSVAGSVLDLAALKKQIAGHKASEAKTIISRNPGVTDVEVTYSPFWVSSIPNKPAKITLTVEKPKTKHAD